MIDLSYLTEEEQEMIVAVLKRDAELKKADEERVKRLRKAVRDTAKLPYLTGEWFYQTKSQRHRDRIHGSDIIRAAMKQRKPMTIMELTQIWAERPSFVNSEIQDIFVPAELSGLIEEPSAQLAEKRASASVSPDVQKDGGMLALQSAAKIRENPFNSVMEGSEASEESGQHFTSWKAEPVTPSEEELLPPSKSHIGSLAKSNSEDAGALEVLPESDLLVKKRNIVYPALDSLSHNDESFPKRSNVTVEQGAVSTLKGILKRSSSCCFADFPVFFIDRDDGGCSELPDSQQPKRNDRPAQRSESLHSLDRKQVRFSATVRMSEMEGGSALLGDGEFGEHNQLDIWCGTFTDEDGGECQLGIGSCVGKSNNEFTHSRATPQCQKERESISEQATMPPSAESQHSRLGGEWEEVDADEAKSSGEGAVMRGQDIGLPQSPCGHNEFGPESSTQHPEDKKGKPGYAKVQGHGLSFRPAEQSLTAEQGCPIAEIQEGYSWLSGGSNQCEKHSHQRRVHEAEEECGIGKETSEKEVKGPESSDTEVQTLFGDVSHADQKTDVFCPYTEATTQREPCFTTVGSKLKPRTEGKLNSQGEAQDETALFSHPVVGEAQLARKQEDVNEEESAQKLAKLRSFWEKGNRESRIPIYRTSTNPKTNETVKEFIDKGKVAGKRWSKSGINVCKVGQELPFRVAETSQAPVTMKSVFGHYTQQFKGRKESEFEVHIKRHSNDSANRNKIMEPDPSLFQKEAHPSPVKDSSHLEECSLYFENRNMLENKTEDDIYMSKPIIISEEVPVGQISDIQTEYEGQEISSKLHSVAASRQTGRQHDENVGKINNLKSFWANEKSGPEITVGKQKGSLETKMNQNPEPNPSCAEKELSNPGPDQRTEGNDIDSSCDSGSCLPSITEEVEKESKNQTVNNAQCNNTDDFWVIVPSVKTVLPSTEDVPQCPRSSYSRSQGTTHTVQEESPLLIVELNPDCPPKIPPRCPIKSKTESCSSKFHSVDVCPPIRELVEKDQIQILQQKKVHSPEGITQAPRVTKIVFEKKGIFSMGILPGDQHSCLPQLCKGTEKSPAGEPLVHEIFASPNDKESRPELPKITSLETLDPNEGNQVSPEVRRLKNERKHREASGGKLLRVPAQAESYSHLARSFTPQVCQHYLGLSESTNRDDWTVPVVERREEGSIGHPSTQPEAGLDVLPESVQPSTPRGPQEESEPPGSMRGSEGEGTNSAPRFVSSRRNTSKIWSNSWASSDCCDESLSPAKDLKQIHARPKTVSKSLEDITSQQTFSLVSTSPSSTLSEQDQMKKRCASMPVFLHGEKDDRDSDSDSENNFHLGGRKSSGSTNFSTSSGMASMSSASSSLMSIYSLEFENVEVKGTIQFALSYVQKLGEFHIFLVRCRDLAVADTKKNRSDPYVKSYLLPDKVKLGKRKTTVKKKTLNPIYNEILRYKIDVETLRRQTLNLSVWHHNSFGRNGFLGEVDFKLSEWDLRNTHMNDFTLKGKASSGLQATEHRGEIRLALRFLQQSSHGKKIPKTGLVQIFVKECKNLPLLRGAAIDPFIKCYVLPDTSRKSRQKSRVLRRTANPVFNHTMVYDGFRAEDLREACVELTVWDHDRLNNHFLGGVRLSLGTGRSYGAEVDWMDSNTAEAMLWEQMIESHNEWVEDVLPLRMLVMAHGMSK